MCRRRGEVAGWPGDCASRVGSVSSTLTGLYDLCSISVYRQRWDADRGPEGSHPALAGPDPVLHQLVLGLNEVSSVGRARARTRDVILVGPRGVGRTVTSSTYGALAAQAPDDPASGPARPEGAPGQVGLDLPERLDQLLSSRGFLDRHPSRRQCRAVQGARGRADRAAAPAAGGQSSLRNDPSSSQ